nr:DUF2577 domain-containing protein [Paenibacillus algorifonticola]
MGNLLQLIKQAATDAVAAGNPVNIMFGEVITVSPLSVRVDQRFVLTEEFFVITETAASKITEGAVFVLLRVQGGQQYLIMDKVAVT